MNTDLLKEYVRTNSNPSSKIDANLIYPKLVHNTNDSAEFFYKGSSKSVYKISIQINRDLVTSSCTCQYNHEGICKHTIAAIRILINGIQNQEILILDSTEKKLKANQILLADDLLTNKIIESCGKPNYYNYHTVKITFADKNKIETQVNGWSSCVQQFSYNNINHILETNCSCSKKVQVCEHIGFALKKIGTTFGSDFFKPLYFEEKIKAHLAKYGMTLENDYEKIFTFELSTTGFKINSKYKNIQEVVSDSLPTFGNENVETMLAMPYAGEPEGDYGLAFCFEFNKKNFDEIIPVQAKFNKARTDFSSSFTPIDFANLNSGLQFFEKDNEQELIVKTLQINSLLKKYKNNKGIGGPLKRAIHYFKEIIPTLQTNFLYKHDDRESLVRKNISPITIDEKPIKLFFTLSESELFYTLKAKVAIDETNYNINATKIMITPTFIFANDIIYPIATAELSIYLSHFKDNAEVNYFKKDFASVYGKVLLPLSKKFDIQSGIFKKDKVKIEDETLEKHVYITDLEGQFIVFKPAIQYPNQLIPLASKEMLVENTVTGNGSNTIIYKERNESFEDNFIEEFKSLHPEFETQDGFYFLTPDQLMENYWMLHATDRMQQMGMKVFGANNLKSFKFNINKPVITVGLKSDIDWFDLEIDIAFGNQKVGLKELQKAFLKKSNYVALGDGSLGILPEEWMKKMAHYFKVGEIKKNGLKFSNYQFGIIDELFEELETKPPFLLALLEKKKRLLNISNIETVVLPKGIKAKLRDYQHHGLNWLVFLDKNQLGGCLADDMGLGKTLQAITFLQYLKLRDKKMAPSLIIAPTSLIFNWKNEVEKFCPSLKLLAFVGSNRMEHKDSFSKYDVVISTYGSLLNDVEFMKDFKFNYLILDESQAIKNPNSKRYKAVRLLNSYNRLVLTGTPIENNTFDLYAQMNFINPGLLGNMSHFKTEFSDAIDKGKNHEASHLLSKMIAPFLLRRTKEQVAKELPEKTESIIFCEMEPSQRKVYDTFKNKYRDYLINKIDENGVENAQMYILEGLTKLRQICNSTALINDDEDYGSHSVKLDLLIENIKEKTGNHKILVFSQFVKMLQLIKTRLDGEQINYEYLDGQTTNREEKVNNFQDNSDVRVFLISLKAGGTGLNLTEADYVFLVDPWWNPAVENQAIDRCYRIGQKRQVMAYRMICKDTIEEKIALLQGKKKAVASSIITIDEEKKSFDVDQVKAFFS